MSWGLPAGQFGVFRGGPSRGLGWVLEAVLNDLLAESYLKVDTENIGELQQVGEHVRQFLANVRCPIRVRENSRGLLRGEPLEDLSQLADLAGEGHDQVLGCVEALPVALGRKLPELVLEI